MELEIYAVILESLRGIRPVIASIAKHDKDLADQLRRAGASVALNTAEGNDSLGGNRRARFKTAHGSASEVVAALDVAECLGYVDEVDAELRATLKRVRWTLHKLAR